MPGTNAGTGQPISFRCAKCRLRAGSPPRDYRYGYDVTLTGKERDLGHSSVRMTRTSRQYTCRYCGHVGWSRHFDLTRRCYRNPAVYTEAQEVVRQRVRHGSYVALKVEGGPVHPDNGFMGEPYDVTPKQHDLMIDAYCKHHYSEEWAA